MELSPLPSQQGCGLKAAAGCRSPKRRLPLTCEANVKRDPVIPCSVMLPHLSFGGPDQTTTFTSLPGTTMTFFTGLPSMNS